MAVIDAARNVLTLINVFTVAPDRQDELVQLLVRATEETMKHRRGFVSASIHRSVDGSRVVNYAQWERQADFDAMQADPAAQVHMKAAAAIAVFDPIVCVVEDSISAVQQRLTYP